MQAVVSNDSWLFIVSSSSYISGTIWHNLRSDGFGISTGILRLELKYSRSSLMGLKVKQRNSWPLDSVCRRLLAHWRTLYRFQHFMREF